MSDHSENRPHLPPERLTGPELWAVAVVALVALPVVVWVASVLAERIYGWWA